MFPQKNKAYLNLSIGLKSLSIRYFIPQVSWDNFADLNLVTSQTQVDARST
jgi:hypothetical protein